MLMFISFPSIVDEWVELSSPGIFLNRIEHQPTGCVNILSKRPLPVGASFTRDLASTARSYKKNTPRRSVPRSLFAPAEQYIYRKAV